ncbi:hypothetical protein O9Z70_11890 [Devosia sp. YIM 151766]|uniref:hypothetical protein n=1 Tax=Devosia sp. YIM 151766 TaxID=3017325 RepID=UPI00255C8BB5|nr:hypothetical protein [Devosia sp. YIM 151766]WIY52162.1 hypothetical protein O9Z70_11890 [Devosia sp. YIM 151766]
MNDKELPRGRKAAAWSVGLITATLLGSLPAEAQMADPPHRDSQEAARAFTDHIERFLETVPLERQKFEVRANRCQAPDGSMRDDIYTIWIGTRLVAANDDAGAVLEEVYAQWQDKGWTLTRDRRLDNGGVNIAAIEPGRENVYSLDSGFHAGPQRIVVGYFNTPCYADPSGFVPFGALHKND